MSCTKTFIKKRPDKNLSSPCAHMLDGNQPRGITSNSGSALMSVPASHSWDPFSTTTALRFPRKVPPYPSWDGALASSIFMKIAPSSGVVYLQPTTMSLNSFIAGLRLWTTYNIAYYVQLCQAQKIRLVLC